MELNGVDEIHGRGEEHAVAFDVESGEEKGFSLEVEIEMERELRYEL